MFLCSRSLIWQCLLSGYWFLRVPQPPFFDVPSFAFKHTFQAVLLRSFRDLSWDGQGYHMLKQFWFFLWYNINCTLAKSAMTYPSDWSGPPTSLEFHASSPAEDSASPSPFGFTAESYSAVVVSYCSRLSSERYDYPSAFWEGKKFFDVWEWVVFDLPAVAVLGGRGSLASVHLSNFLGH